MPAVNDGSLSGDRAGQAFSIAPPVFVLCSGRSGSTLLRFILDAHPALSCPPETNLPALCAQLATVWSLIEGAPLAAEPGAAPPVIPDAAIARVRYIADMMMNAYLTRRGGVRFCDKSLGTARFADLLLRVYPEAKFICLYRHPMDVIASAFEACPWGVTGYGFDPYIAASPGNTVLALARYWTDNANAILAAQDRFPASCYQVRYEDLVTDPVACIDEIFSFLDVPPVPGIASQLFGAERERSGPSDYKIWHTSEISRASVGRGWTIPVLPFLAPVLDQLNAAVRRLGYLEVDGQWGAAARPGDVRAGDWPTANAAGSPAHLNGDEARIDQVAALAGQRLQAGLAQLGEEFARRWQQHAAVPFGIVLTGSAADGGQRGWRVDLAEHAITPVAGDGEIDTEWDILGPPAAWLAVLDGSANLGVALRKHDLRYCDTGEDLPAGGTESRVDMLADFLGLSGRISALPQPVIAG
jgi:sulfotransferase family protein